MVLATEFIDPFEDDIVAFPINPGQQNEWRANIIELIIGAVIFLAIVAIYNALFSIWEKLFGQSDRRTNDQQELEEQDDVFVRVTYAVFVSILAYLIVWYFGPTSGRFSKHVHGRRTQ